MVTIQQSSLAIKNPVKMINDHWSVVILSAGNTWHAFIKSILHIFTEKSFSKLPYLFKKEDYGVMGGGGRGLEDFPNNFAQVATKFG